MDFGILCLLPILVIVVMAVVTKRGIEALGLGVIVSYIMLNGIYFFPPLLEDLLASAGDGDTVWLLFVCAFLGSLSLLLEKSGGVSGLSRVLSKFANTQKKSLFASWLAGIIVFFDDYLNIFVVGSLMKRVNDKNKIPREMLAYVVDSTAAPVCLIIPLSTWVVFFSVILGEQKELAAIGSGTSIYLQSIPFIFYAWAAVLVVPLVILGIIPKFGPMKKAFLRAEGGQIVSAESAKLAINKETAAQTSEAGNPWDFIIPVLALIGITIWTEDILIGLIAANAICFLLYWPRKLMRFGAFFDHALDGFSSAIPLIVICLVSVFARTGFEKLGIADYVIRVASSWLAPEIFPLVTFVLVASLAFVTVSCWGIVSISIPILIPLSAAVGADPLLTVGAILSGSGFGSHACPYEDASVLTAQVTGISYIEHFITQVPYAAISAGLSAVCFLVMGFVL